MVVWRTLDKKRGTMARIISLLTSVRKLTIPKKNTLGLRPKILPLFIGWLLVIDGFIGIHSIHQIYHLLT